MPLTEAYSPFFSKYGAGIFTENQSISNAEFRYPGFDVTNIAKKDVRFR